MSKLVRLYPAAWRQRYGEELLQLIEDRPPTLTDRLDIVRGAVDARLHPTLAGGTAATPWTHRLPGLLALSGGLVVTASVLGIALGSGPDWGAPGDLLQVAFVLMLMSVPGDYLMRFGRTFGLTLAFVIFAMAVAPATHWWGPAVALAIVGEATALAGLVTLAAIRAGITPRGRWLLIGIGILGPAAVMAGHAVLRDLTGVSPVPDGARVGVLAALPLGLVWLFVGMLLTSRGSATFIDPPDGPPAGAEVQAA